MPSRSAAPEVVRLSELSDIVAAIPYQLGFHPTESLVAIALTGARDRMTFTMRHDLMPPEEDAEVAKMCAERMAFADAKAVFLAVYTAQPRRPGRLPRRPLVRAISSALPMELRDAVLVDDQRVWSYMCSDTRCCPPAGRPLQPQSPGALNLAAAHAYVGDVVLPSREALVATTAPVGGVAAVSMRQAIDRAAAATECDVVETSLALVDRLSAGYARGPVALSHDDAAQLMLGAHNVVFRDAIIGRLARGDDDAFRLVSDLARLAQPPLDAPAATMLAMGAYFHGDGVVALAAADRALASDPDYSLAQLLVHAIRNQMDPQHMRDIWSKHHR